MTVSELIELLKIMPQDKNVLVWPGKGKVSKILEVHGVRDTVGNVIQILAWE